MITSLKVIIVLECGSSASPSSPSNRNFRKEVSATALVSNSVMEPPAFIGEVVSRMVTPSEKLLFGRFTSTRT